jgi:hypothetical protein
MLPDVACRSTMLAACTLITYPKGLSVVRCASAPNVWPIGGILCMCGLFAAPCVHVIVWVVAVVVGSCFSAAWLQHS